MAFRTRNTVTTPKGTYNFKKKTFTGKGPAPAGSRKVASPKLSEVPTVTTSPTGQVTTSGFGSKRAARSARKRATAGQRRVRRIQRELLPKPQKRSTPPPANAPEKYVAPRLSADGTRTVPAVGHPASKPAKFEEKPTAGTPTLGELRKAKRAGTLKVNRKGHVATPKVRKVGGTIQRIQKRARKRSSQADLPHLAGEEERNAKTVLRRGEKAKATRQVKLAAVETGLVESGFKNYTDQGETDADSLGWRQERTSIYGTGSKGPTNVKASADRFYHEARTDAGTSTAPTPGLLAQAAQGSAFPERYDEREAEAEAILSAYNRGKLKPGERKKLAKAKKTARKLGLKAGEATPEGRVPEKVLTRFKAARQAAKELEKAELPYVWGGGHNTGKVQVGAGLDCSGSVSYVLQKMGVKLPGGVVSGDMGSYLRPGSGAVTVFYNPEHTFMKIGNQYFGTSASNPGGGAGFIDRTIAEPEATSGKYSVGHVSGLGQKVAVQMGLPPGTQSFPGMTLSSSGTTATIDSGAGATVSEPGFSPKPIRLTPTQKAQRKFRKLEQLGVGSRAEEASETPESSTLAELERKYGIAA